MGFREVSVTEIREVLRLWLRGQGLRAIAERCSPDRKTVRRYVQAAEAAGLVRSGGEAQLTDELLGAVVEAVRPARPRGRGAAGPIRDRPAAGSVSDAAADESNASARADGVTVEADEAPSRKP